MLIAFTGAHSTGKSTLIDQLKQNPSIAARFTFTESVTRKLQQQGFNINEAGNDDTQNAMVDAHISTLNINKTKDCIMDRCLLDVCSYTLYLFEKQQVKPSTLGKALDSLQHLGQYDIIFYLTPEFDIVNDGVRSTSVEFRDRVADIFEALIYPIKKQVDVWTLSGTVEERVEQVLKALRYKGVQC